jgi:hypothetical protein
MDRSKNLPSKPKPGDAKIAENRAKSAIRTARNAPRGEKKTRTENAAAGATEELKSV